MQMGNKTVFNQIRGFAFWHEEWYLSLNKRYYVGEVYSTDPAWGLRLAVSYTT